MNIIRFEYKKGFRLAFRKVAQDPYSMFTEIIFFNGKEDAIIREYIIQDLGEFNYE